MYRQEQLVDALCSGDHVSFTHVCSRMPQHGKTALIRAVWNGHDASAKMLIEAGARGLILTSRSGTVPRGDSLLKRPAVRILASDVGRPDETAALMRATSIIPEACKSCCSKIWSHIDLS